MACVCVRIGFMASSWASTSGNASIFYATLSSAPRHEGTAFKGEFSRIGWCLKNKSGHGHVDVLALGAWVRYMPVLDLGVEHTRGAPAMGEGLRRSPCMVLGAGPAIESHRCNSTITEGVGMQLDTCGHMGGSLSCG